MSKAEKRKLALALAEENEQYDEDKERFIEMLLNGPVYSEKKIRKIEQNTQSIAKWRTKA